MSFFKKKILFITLFLAIFATYPGGVMYVYRIDFNGKRIIFFGERHEGTGSIQGIPYDIKIVAEKQKSCFEQLFARLVQYKTQISLYFEFNKEEQKHLKAFQKENNTGAHFTYPSSFWDRFINGYLYNTNILTVDNFDERTREDLVVLFGAQEFEQLIDKWRAHNFDSALFEQFKQDFLSSPNVILFNRYFNEWFNTIIKRIKAYEALINQMLPVADHAKIMPIINKRLAHFHVLDNVVRKAAFAGMSLLEFLLYILKLEKNNMYTFMQHFNNNQPIENIYSLFDAAILIADLSLIVKLLADQHKLILVHGGLAHMQLVFEFFQSLSQTKKVNVQFMINDAILNDPKRCVNVLFEFIFGD